MRPARSQESEDETESELGIEYRLHQFPPEPTRSAFSPLDLVGLGVIALVLAVFVVAIGLGLVDEVRFVRHLFT